MHTGVLGGPSRGRQIPGSGVTGSCEPLLSLLPGHWEPILIPLGKQEAP